MELKLQDVLKEVYQHCIDMQKIAETKNAGLIAFNGAIVLSAIKLFFDQDIPIVLHYYLYFILLCSLVSIFLNLLAINAQLKHKELEIQNHSSQNLLFFGAIANNTPDSYLEQIKTNYNIEEKTNRYHNDLAKQVVINAQIALRKFKLFNLACKWTIAGVTALIGLLILKLFYNNNK